MVKPVAIYDGRCAFCRIWVDYIQQLTGPEVEYQPSQEAAARFPQIPPEKFRRSVQLVLPTGEVLSGARAAFELMAYAPCRRWPRCMYNSVPGFAALSESAYRFVASHRDFSYWLTTRLFGRHVRPASYGAIEWIFHRALAVIYLIAFVSFGVQAHGLVGSRGILPLDRYLHNASQVLGPTAWLSLPSVFWLNASDAMITCAWIAGAVAALTLLIGIFERTSLVALFVLYLSISSAGQDFLSFQWDILLLETGFLAIFAGSSNLIVWLFRVLVFRLMFSSGAVKLLSHDPAWRNLKAMTFHYFTQPIPNPLSWYAGQFPVSFQEFSTAAVLLIELAIPFSVFLPRRIRFAGAFLLIGLQVLILVTGNFAFFNWLSIALCLFLFDDAALGRWAPVPRNRVTPRRLAAVVTLVILVLGGAQLSNLFGGPGRSVLQAVAPFGIVNSYGLFAVMTTTRPEITVQGSSDGIKWYDYVFRYKPGPLKQPPPFVAPHQPRLDWQMWFAALGDYRQNPWFVNFMVRLLEGSPDVLELLETNPFPHAPPKYVRALLSSYRFTDWQERRATGNWWDAEPRGIYVPAISLDDVQRQ